MACNTERERSVEQHGALGLTRRGLRLSQEDKHCTFLCHRKEKRNTWFALVAEGRKVDVGVISLPWEDDCGNSTPGPAPPTSENQTDSEPEVVCVNQSVFESLADDNTAAMKEEAKQPKKKKWREKDDDLIEQKSVMLAVIGNIRKSNKIEKFNFRRQVSCVK